MAGGNPPSAAAATGMFFLGKRGTAIHRDTLEGAFQRLREHAKVTPRR